MIIKPFEPSIGTWHIRDLGRPVDGGRDAASVGPGRGAAPADVRYTRSRTVETPYAVLPYPAGTPAPAPTPATPSPRTPELGRLAPSADAFALQPYPAPVDAGVASETAPPNQASLGTHVWLPRHPVVNDPPSSPAAPAPSGDTFAIQPYPAPPPAPGDALLMPAPVGAGGASEAAPPDEASAGTHAWLPRHPVVNDPPSSPAAPTPYALMPAPGSAGLRSRS